MKQKSIIMAAFLFCCTSMMAQPKSGSDPQLFIRIDKALMAPTWSPDGSKLAFTGDNYTGVWVVKADGNDLKQLSAENGAGYKMLWSRDGNTILCRTVQVIAKRKHHEIKTVNVATGESKIIVASTRNIQGTPTWKSAGDIAFADQNGNNIVTLKGKIQGAQSTSLYEMMVSDPVAVTTKVTTLSQFSGKMILNPAESSTGKIAFQVPGMGLFVCNADGSEIKKLGRGSYPAWLPDGKNVVVAKTKDDGSVITSSDLVAINITNGNEVNLTSNTNVIPVTHSISPDGKKIAFENSENGGIYIIDLKY